MKKPLVKRVSKLYRSKAEFAVALHVVTQTVSRWTRHAQWHWSRKGPWSAEIVPDVLRWAADTLERGRPRKEKTDPEGTATIGDLREEKLRQEIRKLRAHADQAETALAKERGDLHDAGQCDDEAVRRASLYRTAIQNVPTQVVSLALSRGMPHQSAPEFQQQLEELLNGCLRFTNASANEKSAARDGAGDARPASEGAVDGIAVG